MPIDHAGRLPQALSVPPHASAITVRGLGKQYTLQRSFGTRLRELLGRQPHKEAVRWALRGVDLEIPRGAVFGVVGRNGAGKSTLLRIVAGRLRASEGSVEVRGRTSCVLELGTGLNPNLTGRQNARVNALFLGLDPWQIETQLGQIIEFAELGEYADQPLHTYSSGMRARLAFSVMTAISPEILIIDEALATGDAAFAAKSRRFVRNLCASGCTAMLVSHDTMFMIEACDFVAWIDQGTLRKVGPAAEVCRDYLESAGRPAALEARPRSILLRFDLGRPAAWVTGVCWYHQQKPIMGFDLTNEDALEKLIAAAPDVGIAPQRARHGWHEAANPDGSPAIARRLQIEGAGAAFLAIPVPAAPAPLPTSLYLGGFSPPNVSPVPVHALLNGEYVSIGLIGATGGWSENVLTVPWTTGASA